MSDRVGTIAAVCRYLEAGQADHARRALLSGYPFKSPTTAKRQYGPTEATRVFVRDGFIDRYTAQRVIHPPVLRLVSLALPTEFPFDSHWKTSATHSAYWEVGASIDHLVPVTMGGEDAEPNWVTTSMEHNFAKMNWSLSDLGWTLRPPGRMADWDGLLGWFLRYSSDHPEVVARGNLRQWHLASVRATAAA